MEQTPLALSWLVLLDGLCAACLSAQQSQCPEAFQGRGVVIPESQVMAALSGQISPTPLPGFDTALDDLAEREGGDTGRLAGLLRRTAPHHGARLALLLALAPELNRKYERIFGFLQDSATARRATLGLLADLWALAEPVAEDRLFALCDPALPLTRFVLEQDEAGLAMTLRLRKTALLYLQGGDHLPQPLADGAQLLRPDSGQDPLVHQDTAQRCVRFARRCLEGPEPGLMELCGTAGAGRRFLLRYLARETGRDVLLLDCSRLGALTREAQRELVESAASHCYLTGAVAALWGFDLPDAPAQDREAQQQWLLSVLQGCSPLVVVCCEKPPKLRYDGLCPLRLELPPCTLEEQQLLWTHFAHRRGMRLEQALDPERLTGVYSLTPGQIDQALALAQAECAARGQSQPDRAAVALGVQRLSSPRLAELTEPLRLSFDWDDLMLSDDAMVKLRGLCDRIRHRAQVNGTWGFHQKLPYGRGLSACLYGPPGTGKTMTAQVLAREFGLDAYRVDVSRIMDKYIGETEKKLAELFDAAKDSNAILFFDEADALFAKRTEVGDSKDRYANVETAYLLQRMENHNGVCFLATNAVQNFDEAFKRRISYMIPILMPGPEIRARLWRAVFPPEAPLEHVDLDFFAQRFELAGSGIKNIALSAAFLAAAKGTAITREVLAQATREEYQKMGRVLMEHELF